MKKTLTHTIKYIYWAKESEFVLLDAISFAKKVEYFRQNGTEIPEDKKTARIAWIRAEQPYRTDKKFDKYEQLYTYENGKYYRYSTNVYKDDTVVNPGRDAYNAVVARIREVYGLNRKAMAHCFGTVAEGFKRCIPKQFYHINERYTRHVVVGISGADASSHYPASICGKLPTAKGMLSCAGTVPPSAEYPFAFYLRSGHVAIYNELDTHIWKDSQFSFRLFEHKKSYDWDLSQEGDADETILMKASEYELTPIIKEFYERRASDPVAKLVMNAFIGYLHRESNYEDTPYAHIAAVCLARANQKMLTVAENIGFNRVIQICVDGIMYRGTQAIGQMGKSLGAFTQEFTNCVGRIDSTNRYIIKNTAGTIIKYKMQGCNYLGDKKIDESYIPKYEDMDKWNRRIGGHENVTVSELCSAETQP